MDDEAREAERRWRSSPDDASAERAAATLRRARRPLPWDLIAALPRWRGPLWLASRFSATPPRPDDGCPEEALVAAEARLGLRLPEALREWHRLLGGWPGVPRLQRLVVPLPSLELTAGLLVVLRDGRRRASVREADLSREDPTLFVEEEPGTGRLGRALAATFGRAVVQEVALDGPWAEGVKAGDIGRPFCEPTRAGYRYEPSSWPFFAPYCGVHADDDTLVVEGPRETLVRARTAEAWARAEALLW